MADLNELHITLNVEEWVDGPEAVIEKLKCVETETVTIDASAPEPIGAQIAQLLVAAKKTASENNGHLRIENASDAFLCSLEILGLSSVFEELNS